ncbi:MAG: SURF1 family cytochrome oxidase biogenesis protein, partial [Pseudomonadota bacterium]
VAAVRRRVDRVGMAGVGRVPEPEGTVVDQTDRAAGRWVSRAVAALSADAGLDAWAPFFVDADHFAGRDAWPRGGLTTVRFRNSHLAYALTWYAMAALFFAAMIYVIYDRRRTRAV